MVLLRNEGTIRTARLRDSPRVFGETQVSGKFLKALILQGLLGCSAVKRRSKGKGEMGNRKWVEKK